MAENMQTNGAMDVLAVLAGYAQDTGAFRVSNKGATELAAACAAVAELVEADKAYDEARKAATPDHSGHEIPDESYFKLSAASDRRAAALVRVGGAA